MGIEEWRAGHENPWVRDRCWLRTVTEKEREGELLGDRI
jgi:hypothetical protein